MAPGWLGLLAGVVWAGAATAQAPSAPLARSPADQWERARAAGQVPIEELPEGVRESVRRILEKPTLYSHGPGETFPCRSPLYYWFLDHPDRAVLAWRRLGAKCMGITDRGGGRFGWSDEYGSDITWETIYSGPQLRVWYAQGKVRPSPLMPLVPVRAVVTLTHIPGRNKNGLPLLHHQADLFVLIDSKTAALVTRMLGPSAPRMAEQNIAQMEMFFSALVWYLEQHPERAEALLANGSNLNPPPLRPQSVATPTSD
jgi:hypothetical protein